MDNFVWTVDLSCVSVGKNDRYLSMICYGQFGRTIPEIDVEIDIVIFI